MQVLGIETSCDETAAAVIDGERRILANLILSQLDDHRPYGGVVPEIAARAHLEHLGPIVAQAMEEAGLDFPALDGVAVTSGPGLIGGLMVGVTTAKAIAMVHDIPFLAVNHLEGHALTVRFTHDIDFPYLLLLVSGGHCQLLAVEGVDRYRRYGTTVDDAVGEAFDKAAKMLGLGFPGGPDVEHAAMNGDATRFVLPRPMVRRPGCDFSFSGLKTALRHVVHELPSGALPAQDVADLCASFQEAVGDVLVDRTDHALDRFAADYPTGNAAALVIAGGVAANQALRTRLRQLCERHRTQLVAPPPALCGDNATMIAWAGIERLRLGKISPLHFAPRPRWPLDES